MGKQHFGTTHLSILGADKEAYMSMLEDACSRGQDDVVRMLLDRRPKTFEFGRGDEKSLYLASKGGHVGIVQLLMEHRAKPWEDALTTAVSGGHEEVVRLLIEKGTDTQTVGWKWDDVLMGAASGGHKEIVRLLLGKKSHAGGGYALRNASSRGHDAIVRLLLENGVDVNAEGGFYGYALTAASRDRKSVV